MGTKKDSETQPRSGLRVLGRLRISHARDESTSLERQRQAVEHWATDNGHEVIGWAVDDGVSGSVDPWDTSLGPWLTDRADQFDILCSWKLDRLARRSIALHKLFAWVEENDKRLVCTAEHIDLGHWIGRMMAGVIAGLAEGELEAITERQQASQNALREAPLRFRGGKAPYGYTTAPLDGGGRTLVQHPEHAQIVRRIVDEIIAGVPAGHIADKLNADGVPAPSGEVGAWGGNTIRHIVKSPHLVGHKVHQGQLVVDNQGRPVPITKTPLETSGRQADALTELAKASKLKQTHKASPLSKRVRCRGCKAYLHMTTAPSRREKHAYRYYRCPNCKGSINADKLEYIAYDAFLDVVGDADEMEAIVTRPKDHSKELEHIDNALRNLTNIAKTVSGPTADQVIQDIADYSAKRDRLQAEHDQENKIEWKPTGRGLWRDQFAAADADGKRRILERAGVGVYTDLTGQITEFVTPPDLHERIAAGSSALSPLYQMIHGDTDPFKDHPEGTTWTRERGFIMSPKYLAELSSSETSQTNTDGNNTTDQTTETHP